MIKLEYVLNERSNPEIEKIILEDFKILIFVSTSKNIRLKANTNRLSFTQKIQILL